ncbi:PhnB protein [Nocardia tenerifensis]|uniref:PhnB protein n=1 Tax=Nocardia tenerifensis TaxID=228006 RepID=A0A318JRD9_9NOCA|nr:VOC family protein [Nocardia tenerifensis]PXX57416.1 PhnB protein [Nocardia tenerifensis]
MVDPIPPGQHSLTAYLAVEDARSAIRFYVDAFGAVELYVGESPSGRIDHAELRIGDSSLVLVEPSEGNPLLPAAQPGTSVGLRLYLADVDAVHAEAVRLGARAFSPVKDLFYGDRSGTIVDPFGHVWILCTRTENLTLEEIQERARKLYGG